MRRWDWISPYAGEFYVRVSANCDVPLFDDVTAHPASMSDNDPVSCFSSVSMRVNVVDNTQLPVVIVRIPFLAPACTQTAGSR